MEGSQRLPRLLIEIPVKYSSVIKDNVSVDQTRSYLGKWHSEVLMEQTNWTFYARELKNGAAKAFTVKFNMEDTSNSESSGVLENDILIKEILSGENARLSK
ncbi:hypothetical protein TNCV_4008931 [Trichonephila clavipes]|nr:hypothetical protein TNCV_4008931 [Trichonephila clavipes]